jgi:hypothetical protein
MGKKCVMKEEEIEIGEKRFEWNGHVVVRS